MDKNSNVYVFGFASIVTLIVAVLLAGVSEGLRERKEANELLAKKKDILGGVINDVPSMSDEEVEEMFKERITPVMVNYKGELVTDADVAAMDINLKSEKKKPLEERLMPMYVYSEDEDSSFIVPVRGNGLWDAIWGFIALEEDFNTVGGVSFGHAAETPGLGAEIKDNKSWQKQFVGKEILDESGQFVGITVKKGAITDPQHQVDAISGATITGDGVTAMIKNDVGNYMPYFEGRKK